MHNSSSRSSHSIIKDWDAVSQAVRSHWVLSARTGQATGWFWAHGYDVQARSVAAEHINSSALVRRVPSFGMHIPCRSGRCLFGRALVFNQDVQISKRDFHRISCRAK
ncbi:Uncharacterized protein HZ326_21415 [Fusarium oxysporum f. sp. albedinis]|nr:Uncharacterized protein HZ326_21415 [Fusarium oxysporum f. sp. albedinis]